MKILASPGSREIMRGHPCFDEQAHERVGRVHLPVAPRCNIQCFFCERRTCAPLTMGRKFHPRKVPRGAGKQGIYPRSGMDGVPGPFHVAVHFTLPFYPKGP